MAKSSQALSPPGSTASMAAVGPKKKTKNFTCIGMGCCLFTQICLAVIQVIVKSLTVPSIQKNFSRVSVQFFVLMPIVIFNDSKAKASVFGPPGLFPLMCVRSLVGNLGSVFMYLSVTKIDVGDAVALSFFSTILTGIFAHFYLKEPFGRFDIFMSIMSTCGVLLIVKPPFMFGEIAEEAITVSKRDHLIGNFSGIAAAFFIAGTVILVRRISHINPVLNTFYFSFWGVLFTSVLATLLHGGFQLACLAEVGLAFLHGCLGLSSQTSMAVALRYERAVTFAVCRSIQIILVFLFQIWWLKDPTNPLSLSGAVLIFISATGVALRRFFMKDTEHDRADPVLAMSDSVLVVQ